MGQRIRLCPYTGFSWALKSEGRAEIGIDRLQREVAQLRAERDILTRGPKTRQHAINNYIRLLQEKEAHPPSSVDSSDASCRFGNNFTHF